jgi:ATP-dependent helicase HrpB
VRGAPLLVAVGFSGGQQADGNIYLASAVSRELVEELFAHRLAWQRQVVWDGSQERVVARDVRCLGTLLLADRPAVAEAHEVTAALLDGIRQLGLEALPWNDSAVQLCRRVNLLARLFPDGGWPDCSSAGLLAELDSWLPPGLPGLRSRADLARIDLAELLTARLDGRQRHRLGQLAPTHLSVPSGHRVAIDYQTEGPPVLAVKLQELFGLADTPRVAEGRVPLQVHLLSPARRPIAVTQDLASFWNHGYPEVRRELRGRYPKHPWPEDPWRAVPTRALRPR